MSEASIRTQITSAIKLIVQLQRFSDGKRRLTSVTEISGMERDVIQSQELFRFARHGTAADGQIRGAYLATGVRPFFVEEMKVRGFSVPNTFFDPAVAVI